MSALETVVKIEVDPKDLAKYAAFISAPVFYLRGKLAVVVPTRWALLVVYSEGEPKGEFLKVNARTAEFEWSDERAMDPMYTYLPVIKASSVEGIDL